jgi:DDE superfamily endonuclease
VRDGKELTRCAASRNSMNYIDLLADVEADNTTGDIFIITDNLSSHSSAQTRAWMAEHPRLHHVFIPRGACWLNLQEGWWRLFRSDALAGQSFANADAHGTSHAHHDRPTQPASQTVDLGTSA